MELINDNLFNKPLCLPNNCSSNLLGNFVHLRSVSLDSKWAGLHPRLTTSLFRAWS